MGTVHKQTLVIDDSATQGPGSGHTVDVPIFPKIYTLFKRDESRKVIETKLSYQEFAQLKFYRVEEKLDGWNIRIFWEHESKTLRMFTRENLDVDNTDEGSQVAPAIVDLYSSIKDDLERLAPQIFKGTLCMFAEAIGPGIRGKLSGVQYCESPKFVLLDIYVPDNQNPYGGWWLQSEAVDKIAKMLRFHRPHSYGTMSVEDIVSLVKSNPLSEMAKRHDKTTASEGIIARSDLFMRNGYRCMFKLKGTDF